MAEVADAIKELLKLIEQAPTHSEDKLPAIISGGPRTTFAEEDDRHWLRAFSELTAANSNIESSSWKLLTGCLDNWTRVVLTGSIAGALIGLVYRWMLLPT